MRVLQSGAGVADAPPPSALVAAPAGREVHVTIRGLSKAFGGVPLYQHLDLDLPRGKIVSIFGPNGCGKSTLINMVAGLLPFDRGEVLFDGKTLRQTVIGYVFQNYRDALLPWISARDNVAYPLRRKGMPEAQAKARTEELLRTFDVRFDVNRFPYELSGGQQQLICIMRALAPRPEVLFLDEPFSALDFETTLFIRDKLQEVQLAEGTTMVIVSHDLEDAVFLADRILLLTRRPTRVAEAIDFDMPRPRDAQAAADPRFIATRAHALAVFQREVRAH